MRQVKPWATLALLGSAVFANSAMDLQWVKRWNVSGPVVANFSQVVANPLDGFYAMGANGTR